MLQRLTMGAALAALACAAAAAPPPACADATSTSVMVGANHPKADATFMVGTLRVERYGAGDPALVLIPGLASGSWVWDNVIRAFDGTHRVYAVTLPGNDGVPPAQPPLLDQAENNIVALIAQEHLAKPIVIGHSLGGALAIRLAEDHSPILGAIVSIDGTPVFPATLQMTPAQRKAYADEKAAEMRNASPAQYAQMANRAVASMVTDPARAKQVAALTSKADAGSTAEYFDELTASDMRPQLPNIKVPFLLVVPVPTVLPPGMPAYLANMNMDDRTAAFVSFYSSIFSGASTIQIKPVRDSRHFVMVDQPAALNSLLSDFIGAVK